MCRVPLGSLGLDGLLANYGEIFEQPGVGRGLAQDTFHRRPGGPRRPLKGPELGDRTPADGYPNLLAGLGTTQDASHVIA
jgi:hypothetical protein